MTSSVVHYLMSLLDLVALAMRFYIYVHGYPEKPSDFMYMVHRHTTTPPAPHPASTLRDTLDTVSCTYLLLLLLIAVCVGSWVLLGLFFLLRVPPKATTTQPCMNCSYQPALEQRFNRHSFPIITQDITLKHSNSQTSHARHGQ